MSTPNDDIPRCSAHTSSGRPCKQRPIRGGTVCATHGGSAPQVRRKAEARLAQLELARQVSTWGGQVDVSPPEALLELVRSKAAEVAYWNYRVAQLSDDERAGLLLSRSEKGRSAQGPVNLKTKTVGAHVFLERLHKAQDQLAAYSAAAVRAGIDEALVRIAAVQASAVIELARRAIDAARRDLAADADSILLALIDGGQ